MKDLLKRLAGATRLMKSDAAEEDKNTEATEEATEEKSAFETAVEEVTKSIKDDSEDDEEKSEELSKAKKKKNKKNKKDEKEEEDDDEEEMPAYKSEAFTKSVTEDPEVKDSVEVEPFLRSLAENIGNALESFSPRIDKLEKSVVATEQLHKSHAGLSLEMANLTKGISDVVNAVSAQPEERKGAITMQDRFEKSDGVADYNPRAIRAKLGELIKAKAIGPQQVGIIEGRLNKGAVLPDWFAQYMDAE